ncbi:MAG: FtsX-like permease family protein [Gammaproteobacteria bacterium]|nr:FtsX-like permease family protein [Gammaproteobacteria bacterium]
MRFSDIIRYTWHALSRHRLRTTLMLIAMMIGVAAIIVLTSLGEGARRYVLNEFSSLGTNLIIVIPGKTETTGGVPPMFVGETPRDLTTADANALNRISSVKRVAPVVVGSAAISWDGRERETAIFGSSHSLLKLRHWTLSMGTFLPDTDYDRASAVCIIGATIQRELFGTSNPIGKWLRIGEHRFRVIGVLASKGRSIGIDVQEIAIIPVASAQSLFNTPSLFRILVETSSRDTIHYVQTQITRIIAARHQGEEDVTIITQDAVLSTFDKILSALTYTVAGIAAISLVVAGILIMNIMLISVSQRTAEIGLLKALGATQHKITLLFLSEAMMLSVLGAILGLATGALANVVLTNIYPDFPVTAPLWSLIGAVTVAVLTGLVFGAMPAKRAAQLNPIEALAHK